MQSLSLSRGVILLSARVLLLHHLPTVPLAILTLVTWRRDNAKDQTTAILLMDPLTGTHLVTMEEEMDLEPRLG
jgi:hypothetical protein